MYIESRLIFCIQKGLCFACVKLVDSSKTNKIDLTSEELVISSTIKPTTVWNALKLKDQINMSDDDYSLIRKDW
jgi:hypothetical protein